MLCRKSWHPVEGEGESGTWVLLDGIELGKRAEGVLPEPRLYVGATAQGLGRFPRRSSLPPPGAGSPRVEVGRGLLAPLVTSN